MDEQCDLKSLAVIQWSSQW